MDLFSRATRIGAAVLWLALTTALVCALMSVAKILTVAESLLATVPLVIVIAVGVVNSGSGIFAQPIMSATTTRAEVALTFDDGPDPRFTPPLLELLARRKQKATFFIIGERGARYPELLKLIAQHGHEVANHTWSHSYLTVFKAPRTLARELEKTNALIQSETDLVPRWFRSPVGLLSPRIPIASRLAGLKLVAWSETARDGIPGTSVAQALRRLDRALRPGAILVLHDARMDNTSAPIALDVTAALLDKMDALGLRSVTLSQLGARQ